MRNPYEVLNVRKDASQQEIKKAFHQLALKLHPDRNPGDQKAEEEFKEASAAYDILSNPEKRTQYDQFGDVSNRPQPQPNPFSGMNIEDFFASQGFDDFFGTRRQKQSVFHGQDLHKNIQLEFMEAINGCKKTIKLSYNAECAKCKGTGARDGISLDDCSACNGYGKIGQQQGFMRIVSTCRSCNGTGKRVTVKCIHCVNGQVSIDEKLTITIPEAIEEDTTMRLPGKGLPGINGGPNGDLYITVSIKPHTKFTRKGTAIYSAHEIDYLDALLGSEHQVETIRGAAPITVPQLTNDGVILTIAGGGVKGGNHVVSIKVKMPTSISEQEVKLLEQIRKLRSKDG